MSHESAWLRMKTALRYTSAEVLRIVMVELFFVFNFKILHTTSKQKILGVVLPDLMLVFIIWLFFLIMYK